MFFVHISAMGFLYQNPQPHDLPFIKHTNEDSDRSKTSKYIQTGNEQSHLLAAAPETFPQHPNSNVKRHAPFCGTLPYPIHIPSWEYIPRVELRSYRISPPKKTQHAFYDGVSSSSCHLICVCVSQLNRHNTASPFGNVCFWVLGTR